MVFESAKACEFTGGTTATLLLQSKLKLKGRGLSTDSRTVVREGAARTWVALALVSCSLSHARDQPCEEDPATATDGRRRCVWTLPPSRTQGFVTGQFGCTGSIYEVVPVACLRLSGD